ncbi:CoA transferase [Sphingomonas sp.]|uniref:CaiB/BaiF CoA-transferase family protein n=1 Tax=Sphingomonas sp. TaxID=28214 RepID=UPI0035C7BFC8
MAAVSRPVAGESDALDRPLAGVRVVECVSGTMAHTARLLADLGAEVIRVEPAGGGADRREGPMLGGESLSFAAANLGKRAVAMAVSDPGFDALLAAADILIENSAPGSDAHAALDPAGRAARHTGLVVVSLSDFGQVGPWRTWRASDPVFHALTGGLSRSGLPDRAPLLPPGELFLHAAATQAAVITLAAFIQRLRDGRGDHVDVALVEAGMAALDPGFGIAGSAQSGVPLWKMLRGRFDERHRYPIVACADGHVRLCIMAPRQWRGMWEWMGRPEAFAGPEWEKLQTRFRSPDLIPAIAALLANKTRAEVEAEAAAHGVPAAALLDLDEGIANAQVVARGAFKPVSMAGVAVPMPDGALEIDGQRAGPGGGVPTPSEGAVAFDHPRGHWTPPPAADRPLAGLKVLDMGVIVVGAETGRLLADLGADVVKVENGAFPDGQRQSRDNAAVSITFAAGHRNKRGLSIDLRADAGQALFARLVAEADVLLSNFKPGTLDALGFAPDRLRALNPRLVSVDSSAFGATGPWSRRGGYGPLVRCSAGLSKLWVYPADPASFADAVTVYPDHVAARVGALGALALLIRRMRTGAGGRASVSQMEVMMAHLAPQFAARAAAAAGVEVTEPEPERTGVWGIYPAAGDDEWVVVTARDEAEWHALARAIDRDELIDEPDPAARDAVLIAWTSARTADEAAALLQRAGVPAGRMLRVVELPEQAQFGALGTFRHATHPLIAQPITVEAAPARSRLAAPEQRPAPWLGEHSAAVLADWLALSDAEIAALAAAGTIEIAA